MLVDGMDGDGVWVCGAIALPLLRHNAIALPGAVWHIAPVCTRCNFLLIWYNISPRQGLAIDAACSASLLD
jgi:hypothetical protein